jgi:hypothetical protein
VTASITPVLSTGAKAGIGVAAAVAGLAIIALVVVLSIMQRKLRQQARTGGNEVLMSAAQPVEGHGKSSNTNRHETDGTPRLHEMSGAG